MCTPPLHNKFIGMSKAWAVFSCVIHHRIMPIVGERIKIRNYIHKHVLGNCANELTFLVVNNNKYSSYVVDNIIFGINPSRTVESNSLRLCIKMYDIQCD